MNPCVECDSADGPRLVGAINAPFVACGDCNAIGPKRKTAEGAIKAWDALNPSDEPLVKQMDPRGHRTKKSLQPNNPFLAFTLKAAPIDIREKIEFEKGRWV